MRSAKRSHRSSMISKRSAARPELRSRPSHHEPAGPAGGPTASRDPYATTPTRDVASVDRTWSRRGPIEQLEVTTVFGFTMLRDMRDSGREIPACALFDVSVGKQITNGRRVMMLKLG